MTMDVVGCGMPDLNIAAKPVIDSCSGMPCWMPEIHPLHLQHLTASTNVTILAGGGFALDI
jgi:hypothetical protein